MTCRPSSAPSVVNMDLVYASFEVKVIHLTKMRLKIIILYLGPTLISVVISPALFSFRAAACFRRLEYCIFGC